MSYELSRARHEAVQIRRTRRAGGAFVQSQNILLAEEAEAAAKKNVHIILPPPKIVPLRDVFANAMLEKTFSHHRHSTKEPAANAGAHFVLPPPKAEPLHEVLADVMLENNSVHPWRGPADLHADAR